MNLLQARELVWSDLDHAPAGAPEMKKRTDDDIRRALFDLFNRAPYLFREQRRVLHLDPDITMEADGTDTLSPATTSVGTLVDDAWVFVQDLPVSAGHSSKWLDTTRSLAGRTLRVLDPDYADYYHYFTIRDVWTETDNDSAVWVHISVVEPIPNLTWSGLEWRVLTSDYAIPSDIMRIKSVDIDIDGRTYPVNVTTQARVEDDAAEDHGHVLASSGGRPWIAYTTPHQELPRPRVAPVAAVVAGTFDQSTTPASQVEYFVTLSMGFRHPQDSYQDPLTMDATELQFARYTPWLESSPSPVSNTVTISDPATQAVRITIPDFQSRIGFGDNATLRYQHTGLWVNIYRRVVVASSSTEEASEQAYLIDRMEVDGTTTYTDNGTKLSGLSAPLREDRKYLSMRFDPFPDENYRVWIRSYVRGVPPVDDYDNIPIPDDAQDCLLFMALQYAYQRAGNAAMAQQAKVYGDDAIKDANRRYGDKRPRKTPLKRQPQGVHRARRWRSRLPTGLVTDF